MWTSWFTGEQKMESSKQQMNLAPGDVVLMSYEGDSTDGQVFQFLDKVGLDPAEDSKGSDSQDSQREQTDAGTGNTDAREPDVIEVGDPDSVIRMLEQQRAVIDRAIRELQETSLRNRDVGTTGVKETQSPVQPRRFPVAGRSLGHR